MIRGALFFPYLCVCENSFVNYLQLSLSQSPPHQNNHRKKQALAASAFDKTSLYIYIYIYMKAIATVEQTVQKIKGKQR